MFQVPEWGNDIPSCNENLKPVSKKKNNKTNKTEKRSQEIPKLIQKTSKTRKKVNLIAKNSLKKNVNHKSNLINHNNKDSNHAKFNISNDKLKTKKQISLLLRKNNVKNNKIKNDKCKDTLQKANSNKNNLKSPTKLIANDLCTSKHKITNSNDNIDRKNKKIKNEIDIPNYDVDNLDEMIMNAKKQKLVDEYRKEDNEETLFVDKASIIKKKNKLKVLLKKSHENNTNRTPLSVNTGNELRREMLERLNAAKFRYLNEQLYTSSGSDAHKLFQSDPTMFQTYHQGYQQQVKKWPVNPLDLVVKRIQNMPKSHVIADLGCGEAALAARVSQAVRSFDLVSAAPHVEACDMAHTPLPPAAVDVAVYCLALMGTDLTQYLLEANRILKIGGHLLIAEVESRFDDVDSFVKDVQRLGFTLKKLDKSHQVFFFMEFVKAREAPSKKSKLPTLSLKPCIYKKR